MAYASEYLALKMHADVYVVLEDWINNNHIDIAINGLLRVLISESINYNWLGLWSDEVDKMKYELTDTSIRASDGVDDGLRLMRVRTNNQNILAHADDLYDWLLAAMAQRDIGIDELSLGYVVYKETS